VFMAGVKKTISVEQFKKWTAMQDK